jgi:gliding motility-associated-like protein
VANSSSQCKTVGTVSVTQNTTPPAASINPPAQINCTTSVVSLVGNPASGATYNWSGPSGFASTSGSPNATLPGTYNLTVTSTANNCTATANANVVQNTTVSATATSNGTITCDPNTLSINLFASPGGMNYTWTATGGGMVTSGQTAANATGYGAGTYSLFLYNPTNGCTASSTVAAATNTIQGLPAASSTGTVNCSTYTLNLSSTTAGVTYTWVAPAGASVTSPNASVTAAQGPGTYTLYVTNAANSCTNSNVVSVTTQTTNPSPSISTSPTPTITCSNSTVTLNGSPASGATYTWSGPGITGSANNANVSITSPGVYSLAVTSSSNGCSSTSAATVNVTSNTVIPTLSASSQTAAQGCGSSSVVVLSGTATPAGSTYTWTSGGTFASGVNSSTVSANSATTYTLNSAHPTTGCISSLVYTVMPSSGAPTVVATGAASGTITCINTTQSTTVTSNPSNNVTYSWSGPGIVGASNTSVVTGSLAGTYNLVVTNTVNNCSSSNFSFVITPDNSPITPNASATNSVDCISTTADITTNPSPAGTFTYSWSNGANTPSITVSPTTNTNYVVTITDTNNGCTGTQTINVTASTNPPTAVSVSPNAYTITCADNTSTITASATGASTYTWLAPAGGTITSGANTPTVNLAGAGIYTLIATGANGCSAAATTATVTPDINQPQVSFSNSSPSITCNGSASINGTSLTITSGTVTSYSWSPAFGVSSSTSSAVTFNQAGTYTVDIMNSNNGCSNVYTVQVTDATATPSNAVGTATAQPLNCTNTVVTISPTFTDTNLSYNWTGTGIVGSSSSSSVQVNQAGTYTLVVTNTLTGCSNSISPVTVPVTGSSVPPTATIVPSSTIGISCQPTSSTITLDAQASTAVTYTWSTAANTSSITTSTPGVYTLTVTDVNNGCVGTATIDVQNNATAPTLTSSASGSLPCGGGTTSLSAVSSNTNVSYTWMGNGIVSGSNTASPVIDQPGIYTVTALDAITGCSTFTTITVVQTTVSALAAASTTMGPAPLNVNFSNQSLGAATYSWSFGDGNSSITTAPSNSYLTPGTYTVVLVATNGGCSDSDTLIIKVQTALGAIPEVFTPNGDGKNDLFVIDGLDSYPNNNFQVFNRWGNSVYTAKPYKNDWNGSPNAQGAMGSGKLPTGTYYYILELGDEAKTIIRGFVQVQY